MKKEVNVLRERFYCVRFITYKNICGHSPTTSEAHDFFRNLLNTDNVHYKSNSFVYWLNSIKKGYISLKKDISAKNKKSNQHVNRGNLRERLEKNKVNNNCKNHLDEITRLRLALERECERSDWFENKLNEREKECERLRNERLKLKRKFDDSGHGNAKTVITGNSGNITINYK